MSKVFLYMYPIEANVRQFYATPYYYKDPETNPYNIFHNCIAERYRNNGYKVVWLLYKQTAKCEGIIIQRKEDEVIYTNMTYDEASSLSSAPPDPKQIIKQLIDKMKGNEGEEIEKLVISGYHSTTSVRDTALAAREAKIKTMVDLDLTELFIRICRRDGFNKSKYDYKTCKRLWVESELGSIRKRREV